MAPDLIASHKARSGDKVAVLSPFVAVWRDGDGLLYLGDRDYVAGLRPQAETIGEVARSRTATGHFSQVQLDLNPGDLALASRPHWA